MKEDARLDLVSEGYLWMTEDALAHVPLPRKDGDLRIGWWHNPLAEETSHARGGQLDRRVMNG